MAHYTNSERTDMIRIYGEAGGNASEAKRIYMERFPQRMVPDARTFQRIDQHLRDYGSFEPQYQNCGAVRTQRVLDLEPQILEIVEEEPNISSRRLALRVGVSASTVWRTLHEQGLHPYHVQRVQALQPGDPIRRIAFCQWFLQKLEQEPNFLNNLLMTDEAGFTREGIFNSRNTHVWSDENPHAIRERGFQQHFSLNVWAGIVGDHLIGPYILPPRLNAEGYLHFLRNVLNELLEDVPLANRREMWLLQDGAPAHSSIRVRRWLNNNFEGRWIGRYGPVLWPPRSPDLNACDFFLWGYMKQQVYSSAIASIDQLRERVEQAAQNVRQNPAMFARTRLNMERRLRACIFNEGRHFEHLL